jgi:hypothetical protein
MFMFNTQKLHGFIQNYTDLIKMEIACTSHEDITNKKDTSFV